MAHLRLLLLAATVMSAMAPATSLADALTPREERENAQCQRFVMPSRLAVDRAAQLAQAGNASGARRFLDDAAEYDPLSPHVYLARARYGSPTMGAAFSAMGDATRAAVTGFPNQLVFSLNAFVITLWVVTLGLIGTAGAIVFRYARHVHHSLYETLQTRLGRHASILAAIIILVPVLWGFGLIATLLFFLLWFSPLLHSKERSIAYGVIALGGVLWIVHFVAPGPLGPPGYRHQPYRLAHAFEAGGSPGYLDALEIDTPPGYPNWARGLMAKRQDNLVEAEKELRAAGRILPNEYGVLNDLGNVLFAQGKFGEARATFEAAGRVEPSAPEPAYNLAQLLSEELDVVPADETLQQALRLDRGQVAAFQASSASKLPRATIDVTPDPKIFWEATLNGRGVDGAVPLPHGLRILSPGGRVALIPIGLFVMGAFGTLAAHWLRRTVRTYACGSCGRIVCRRCLVRIDGLPYCQDCGQTLSTDCSAEYSRALLKRYFTRDRSLASTLSAIIRWLLPGWAEASEWPVGRSVLVLCLCGGALLAVTLPGLPVTGYPSDPPPTGLRGLVWIGGAALYVLARLITWRWNATASRTIVPQRTDAPERKVVGG